jgi:hypothetical protein
MSEYNSEAINDLLVERGIETMAAKMLVRNFTCESFMLLQKCSKNVQNCLDSVMLDSTRT